MHLEIVLLPHAIGLPSYATDGAAGFDLQAAIAGTVRINAGARMLVPTGLRVAVPAGHEMQIRPRSGIALKHGISCHFGTVDSDYRGEVGVIIHNESPNAFYIERGLRIAQAVLAPVVRALFVVVADLDATARGAGGFGSTGT